MTKEMEDIIWKKLCRERLSEEESGWFEAWMAERSHRQQYRELLRIRNGIAAIEAKKRIDYPEQWERLRIARKRKKLRIVWRQAAVAAAVAVIAGSGWWLWPQPTETTPEPAAQVEIMPGRQVAVLTLGNGEQVELADSLVYHSEHGTRITNTKEGGVSYQTNGERQSDTLVINRIDIPVGGIYKLKLADGTTVWLNSKSTLEFPEAFAGARRVVKLEGEAYFDVAKDEKRPFIVRTEAYNVCVTGTQFNVQNYPGEPVTTTLVEGGVRLKNGEEAILLRPGQQGYRMEETWQVKEVSTDNLASWRNGMFIFRGERLEDILKCLARWYDFETTYLDAETKDYHFTASFNCDAGIEEVTHMLKKTKKIDISISRKSLIVSKK